MRILALSDIHVDFNENYQWLRSLSEYDFTEDVLILAGDVTDNRSLLVESFKILARRFFAVLFVPGNHDLWILRQQGKNSLEAFYEIQQIAVESGLFVEPRKFGDTIIIPLLGWYDYSFGRPDEALRSSWVDFKACLWPQDSDPYKVTQHFVKMNRKHLEYKNEKIITFSHFLPRIDLMPRFLPAKAKMLYPVLGTMLLEEQIRTLMPKIHIYGHSHLNRDLSLGNIRYVNNAFGYPYETRITAKKILCVDDLP